MKIAIIILVMICSSFSWSAAKSNKGQLDASSLTAETCQDCSPIIGAETETGFNCSDYEPAQKKMKNKSKTKTSKGAK